MSHSLRYFVLAIAVGCTFCGCSTKTDQPSGPVAQTSKVPGPNVTIPRWISQRKPPSRVAIVFVHGIFGDTVETWHAPSSPSFFDLINQDAKIADQVDIFAFGYPSTFTSNGSFTIFEASDHLYSRLKYNGVLNYQTMVFVAHSMGGLVVLQSIIDHPDIANHVPLVVLYSTPQEGAEIARIADRIAGNPALKNMIPADEQNDGLMLLSNRWRSSGPRPHVICAYEKLPTNGVLIVKWSSATRFCDATSDAIAADHINIVKPHSREDDAYITFANAFSDYVPLSSESTHPNSAATAAAPVAPNDKPSLRFTYETISHQHQCTGRVEKFGSIWSEFIPNDENCNPIRVDFMELGRDSVHFYIYDPNRNLTTRIPIEGGPAQWILGKIPPSDSSREGWGPVYQATKVSN